MSWLAKEGSMRRQACFAIALALFASPALAAGVQLTDAQLSGITAGNGFSITNDISDQPGVAAVTDPSLVNSWGMVNFPGGPLWVADNGPGVSTLYDPNSFQKLPLTVNVPGGAPTGIVVDLFDPPENIDFIASENGKSGHSFFMFATETGNIDAWAPNVDMTNAIIEVSQPNSVFKGLTLADFPQRVVGKTDDVLYAADFANNRVDEYNSRFQLIGSFTDPNVPVGFAPFNVAYLNGFIYVTYAQQKRGTHDEVDGPGLGYLDLFTTQGHLVKRLVSNSVLNAPWGLAIAPAKFGPFAGQLLVGNFGDGSINVFNPFTGKFEGRLTNPDGSHMMIDGLWALINGPNGSVTFSSGPDGENHGLVGSIAPFTPASMVSVAMHSKGTAMTGLSAIGH
jgi:uncharacterized protein (TIGR03118 family)